jgi:hypothetical protein
VITQFIRVLTLSLCCLSVTTYNAASAERVPLKVTIDHQFQDSVAGAPANAGRTWGCVASCIRMHPTNSLLMEVGFQGVRIDGIDTTSLTALLNMACGFPRDTHVTVDFASDAHLPTGLYNRYFWSQNQLQQFGVVEGDCNLLNDPRNTERMIIGDLDPKISQRYFSVITRAGVITDVICAFSGPKYIDQCPMTNTIYNDIKSKIEMWRTVGMPAIIRNEAATKPAE